MGKVIGIGLILMVVVAMLFGAIGRATAPVIVAPEPTQQIVAANVLIAEAAANGSVEITDRTVSEASTVQTLTDAQTKALEIQAAALNDASADMLELGQTGYTANVAIAALGFNAVNINTLLLVGGACLGLFLLWKVLAALAQVGKKTEGGGNGQ